MHTPDTPARPVRWPNSRVTLAIETSCDDTCVAILETERPSASASLGPGTRSRLLFEERITADNRAFGGIHPLTAAVSHTVSLPGLVHKALASLPRRADDDDDNDADADPAPDFVSVTRGPGMQSSLLNGLQTAKGLALAWRVPLLAVHHMQAHALTPRLVSSVESEGRTEAETEKTTTPAFPYLSLLVSGGHTLLVHTRGLCDHRVLAAAHNIALGDLLDKCARAILPPAHIATAESRAGRSVPFGALLEQYADLGASPYAYPLARRDEMQPVVSRHGWTLDAPMGKGALRNQMAYNFSSLNGAAIALAEALGDDPRDDERRDLARATMHLAFEHLASRVLMALKSTDRSDGSAADATCLVVAGGVASNAFLRRVLRSALDVHGFGHLPVVAPPPSLCTDNAAMIAWAGMEMYDAGWASDLGVGAIRKWSMDPDADDGGILGVGGWVRREPEPS